MADQLTTGPALDAAACQALHDRLMAAGKPEMAEDWEPLCVEVCRTCGYVERDNEQPRYQCCHAWREERTQHSQYCNISSDGNVMLRALEHMRELGHLARMAVLMNGGRCEFRFFENSYRTGETVQEAVARAIVAAPGVANSRHRPMSAS